MKRVSIILLLVIYWLSAFSQAEITSKEVYNIISYLADDNKKGRFPGTPESKEVANYIRNEYKNLGLKLLGDNGFQYFKIKTTAVLGKGNFLKINNKKFNVEKDYVPLAISKNGTFKGGAVIVGYGIVKETDSLKWNDYQNVNVKGKWAIVFRGVPQNSCYPEGFFKNEDKEYSKIKTAQDHGAIGVIFITPKDQYKGKMIPFQLPRFYAQAPLPAISVNRKVAEYIFNYVKLTLDSYEEKINKKPLAWEELSITIEAKINVKVQEVQTQNIVAMLEGSNPKLKNRYIVIGAHYDHLGMGGYESGSRMPDTIAVHNGADDNGSGTAGVLELAEYLANHKNEIGRSIIFINFGAEERGLLGSQYFVDHPLVPLDSIDLMINMDMIGQYSGTLSVMGIGSGDAIKNIITKVNYDTTNLKVKFIDKSFGGSDHASFYKAGVPALFFYSSKAKGYHTPFDDIENINAEKEAEILRFIAKFAIKASNYPKKIKFIKTNSIENPSKESAYGKVKLGIIPDYTSNDNNGLKISGVVDGGPAQKAGLQADDIIIDIDGKQIKNIYDYMAVMKTFKRGKTLKIIILRNGKKKKIDVLL